MKHRSRRFSAMLLCTALLIPCHVRAETGTATSLRQTVPADAFMAMAWQRNPEQDFQREHLAKVVQTIKDERIVERVIKMIRDRMEEDDLEEAQEGIEALKQAVAPASLDALMDPEEIVYCQVMEGRSQAQHMVAIRMTPDAVLGCLQAARNLIEIATQKAGEEVNVSEEEVDGAHYLTVYPPEGVPMQPTLVAKDDVLVFSTSLKLAKRAALTLDGETSASKFDDPRVVAALDKLPPAEDMIMVVDGKQQFASIHAQVDPVLENIRAQAEDNPQAAVAMRLIEALLAEANVGDLDVSVGYTKGGNNHNEVLSSLLPGSEDRILRKVIVGNKPIDAWSRWVPADAVNFSVNSGFNVLEVYHDLLDLFSREAAEMAAEALIKLEELQQQTGLSLEGDLLGLFSGETVSVTLPGGQSVTALACPRPEAASEMMHRLVNMANQFPQVQQQNLELVESETLEGFEDLRANLFAMFNVRPVIGFKEGWMIAASSPEAAQAVMDVRWGEAADITTSESFQRFGVEIDGPVTAVAYADTATNIRNAAQLINQAAAMAPLFLGPAMAEAKPEDAKTAQQALALLPSVSKVIQAFDFMEASLSYNKPGDAPGTYRKHTVMLIRQD